MSSLKETESPSAVASEEAPAVLTGGSPSGSSAEVTVDQISQTLQAIGIPQLGAYRTADHRYYWNGKGPLPSVTTILGVLDKPAIVQWAKRTVAEMAVNRWEELGALIQKEGTEAAIKWLASLPDYVKQTAGTIGSNVHLLADMAARGPHADGIPFQVSDQERPYLDAFLRFLAWLKEQGGEIVSSEKMVWSVNGYAGTYDLIVKLPNRDPAQHHSYCQYHREGPPTACTCAEGRDKEGAELWLLDIKTSKGYYPEYALQLIAYGYADQIIIEGNPNGYPMPVIQKYGVLHLRPELYPTYGYRLVQYPVIETDYVAFLGALEVYRWKEERRYTKSILSKNYVT